MKDQIPPKMLTPTQVLEMKQVLSETLRKLQSAKNQKELTIIVDKLTKEQPELMECLQTVGKIGLILTALVGLVKTLGTYKGSPMTTEQLRILHQNSGLSQTDLSKALSVPQSNLSEWLNGTRSIPQKHAEKIHRICVDTATKRLQAISSIRIPEMA
jgi:DNA-binding transcriptional regulator YiaG